MNRHLALGLAAAIAIGGSQVALAQTPVMGGDARLVRCAPGIDLPCLVGRLELTPEELRFVGRADSATAARAWSGRLAGARLVGPTVRGVARTSAPFRLLVLVDLSGSMRGEGVAFVRSALRSFIAGIPTEGVQVAVAPFESRQVAERITAARFVSPAEAVAALDALPAPDAAGNTALYSAIQVGVGVLDRAVRAAPAGTRGGLLVLTDGKNDVSGRRDDPGLLTGPDGRRVATEAAARSGHALWIIGAGGVEPQELRALAGPQGQPYIIALNPILLGQSLAAIAQQIGTERELTFGLSTGSRLRLARSRIPPVVRYRVAGGGSGQTDAGFARLLAWRPPLYALPAYEGIADSTSLPAEVRAVMGFADSDASRRWLLALFFGLIGVVAGGVLPRVSWWSAMAPAPAPAPAPSTDAAAHAAAPAHAAGGEQDESKGSAAASPATSGGLRRDVQEAPPRTPDEVTASSARRVTSAP